VWHARPRPAAGGSVRNGGARATRVQRDSKPDSDCRGNGHIGGAHASTDSGSCYHARTVRHTAPLLVAAGAEVTTDTRGDAAS